MLQIAAIHSPDRTLSFQILPVPVRNRVLHLSIRIRHLILPGLSAYMTCPSKYLQGKTATVCLYLSEVLSVLANDFLQNVPLNQENMLPPCHLRSMHNMMPVHLYSIYPQIRDLLQGCLYKVLQLLCQT